LLYNQADWSSNPSAFLLPFPLGTICDWEGGAVELAAGLKKVSYELEQEKA
jgi:hypothetical protein